jgi:hypothetical protein
MHLAHVTASGDNSEAVGEFSAAHLGHSKEQRPEDSLHAKGREPRAGRREQGPWLAVWKGEMDQQSVASGEGDS